MSIRDELMRAMADEDGLPSTGHTFFERDYGPYADAILARFPHMSADRSLYDYADSLRTQLNAANAELEKERAR